MPCPSRKQRRCLRRNYGRLWRGIFAYAVNLGDKNVEKGKRNYQYQKSRHGRLYDKAALSIFDFANTIWIARVQLIGCTGLVGFNALA